MAIIYFIVLSLLNYLSNHEVNWIKNIIATVLFTFIYFLITKWFVDKKSKRNG